MIRTASLLFLLAGGCASTARQAPPEATAHLTVHEISPSPGEPVDEDTVISARVEYAIEEYSPDERGRRLLRGTGPGRSHVIGKAGPFEYPGEGADR